MTRSSLFAKLTKPKAGARKDSVGPASTLSSAMASYDSLATMVDSATLPQAWTVPLSLSKAPASPPHTGAGFAEMLDEENMAWGACGRRKGARC